MRTLEQLRKGLERARIWPAVEIISEKHGVECEEIIGRSREAHIMRARKDLYVAMRETYGLSFPVIGRLLDRDHQTIISGVRPHEKALRALHPEAS